MKTWVTATILALVVLVAAGITVGVVAAKKKQSTDKTPVETTVVTEKNVYRSNGSLDTSKAQCAEQRTFVNYDRETCKAYQVHNNFEWKTESILLPKGCTQTSRNGKTYVTFNSDHGVNLCRKRNRNNFAKTVCRNAYRDARSVGFCRK